MLALAALTFGILLSLLAGGSLRSLSSLRLKWEWLILPLYLGQGIARGRLPGLNEASLLGRGLWIAVSAILVVALLANWKQPGILVVALGMALNMDVVLANFGMPVSIGGDKSWDMAAAGNAIDLSAGFYHLTNSASVLAWLGDAMSLRVFGHGYFFSVGDVLLVVGVLTILMHRTLMGSVNQSEDSNKGV